MSRIAEASLLVFVSLLGCGRQSSAGRGDPSALFPPGSMGTTSPSAGASGTGGTSSTAAAGAPSGGTGGTQASLACNARRVTKRVGAKVNSRSAPGEPKILGGHPSEFKGIVALTYAGTQASQYCAGTLIRDQWVLTAAHCNVSQTDKVVVGISDLSKIPPDQVVDVEAFLVHEGYNEATREDDIALVKLARKLPSAHRVDLYEDAGLPPGALGTVVGWGRTAENGQPSPTLLEVDVPFVTNERCKVVYQDAVTEKMLCAGAPGKDSCQGDSGGPIGPNSDGAWRQAGIVSFGIGCGRPEVFGVYTRVSKYIGWIEACTTHPSG